MRIRPLLIILGAAVAAALYAILWMPRPPAPAPKPPAPFKQKFPGHPRPPHPPIPGLHLYVDDTITYTA